jgi:hypothetical protein
VAHEAHKEAAEHQEKAAKSHRTAAEHHEKEITRKERNTQRCPRRSWQNSFRFSRST